MLNFMEFMRWEPASAGKPASAAAAKPDKEPDAKPNSAPAKAAEAPAAKPAAAKGNGSAIASMWSKAPAKKGRKPAPKQAAAQPSLKEKAAAVDAEAFMRLNQQVEPHPEPCMLWALCGVLHIVPYPSFVLTAFEEHKMKGTPLQARNSAHQSSSLSLTMQPYKGLYAKNGHHMTVSLDYAEHRLPEIKGGQSVASAHAVHYTVTSIRACWIHILPDAASSSGKDNEEDI